MGPSRAVRGCEERWGGVTGRGAAARTDAEGLEARERRCGAEDEGEDVGERGDLVRVRARVRVRVRVRVIGQGQG